MINTLLTSIFCKCFGWQQLNFLALSEWKDGQCSVSCGVGTYTTTRFCYVQKTGSSNKEKVDFSKCGSDTNEITNPCTEPTCPGINSRFRLHYTCLMPIT